MPDALAPEFVALQQAVAGRYSLERELGRGGMGIVFLVRDVALDRLVAIKLLPPGLAARPGLRERFLREARTAAKLSQPNIVPIYAVEEQGDLVFFVMAYIEGTTLGERLRDKGPLTPHEAARFLRETAWALGYAHGRGVVHRDVKPDNIMLERGSGRAVVMDFGIAGAAGGAAEGFGTAQYVSPEQANGDPVDGRSDLYSLGAVAFLALTGRLPFEAEDTQGLLAMHIAKPAPTVLSVSPGIPRRLAQAVDRCLAKPPADRFPDGEALADAVSDAAQPRRELPVPVRVWLTKGDAIKPAYVFWYVPIGIGFSAWLYEHLAPAVGPGLAMAATITTYALLPLAFHGVYRTLRLQRLLEDGFRLEDIRMAVRELAERRREELTFQFGGEPPLPARVIRSLTMTAYVALAGFGIGALATHGHNNDVLLALLYSVIAALSGTLIGRAYPGTRVTTDLACEMRLKFWESRAGRWLERVARIGIKPRTVPAELTYRPTEMAIGLAADALFESLPRDQRKELKELPALMQRLQRDAALMRRTVDELNGALAGLGEESDAARSSALAADAAGAADLAETRTRLRADLAARRDEAAQRLAAAVAALETVRLNLLRLKAGVGSVDELTADLSAARAITQAMDESAAGRAEVERLLHAGRASPLLSEPQHG